MQTQITTIYQILAAHGFVNGASLVSKSGIGSLFSGVASKFGRSATLLNKIVDTFPSTAKA